MDELRELSSILPNPPVPTLGDRKKVFALLEAARKQKRESATAAVPLSTVAPVPVDPRQEELARKRQRALEELSRLRQDVGALEAHPETLSGLSPQLLVPAPGSLAESNAKVRTVLELSTQTADRVSPFTFLFPSTSTPLA
jgi:hypothetical protein